VAALFDKVKAHSRIVLATVACVLAIYVGSYIYLSAQGMYGPEYMSSLVDGPEYNWEPKGFHNIYGQPRWNRQTYFYLPLFLLDRWLWHRTLGKPPPQ
jgi:hypothetical protein